MPKKQNGIGDLVNKAIDASIKFEALMDRIDFNSYLEEKKEEKNVKDTDGYKLYDAETKEASECLKKVLDQIGSTIKRKSLKPDKETKLTQGLMSGLFEAKKIRLEARKKTTRKEVEKNYIKATHLLHKAFDKIPQKDFVEQEDKSLPVKSSNWAKVLYYNELAICYSGLAKSSMSLGYAELSASLLEDIYPKLKNIGNKKEEWTRFKKSFEKKESPLFFSHLITLYTFALYNKGEAERLLHYEAEALITFRRVIKIYETWKRVRSIDYKQNNSDHISALLWNALILNDMGRGKETIGAIEELEKICRCSDRRFVDTKLEKAVALIDSKEYEKAYEILKDFKAEEWEYTFAARRAEVHILRLLSEFKKNKPEDCEKSVKVNKKYGKVILKDVSGVDYDKETEKLTITLDLKNTESVFGDSQNCKDVIDDEMKRKIETLWCELHPDSDFRYMQEIKNEFAKFIIIAEKVLKKSFKREDGSNAKKVCRYMAEYFKQRFEEKPTAEDFKEALKYFYLYLYVFDCPGKIQQLTKIRNSTFEKLLSGKNDNDSKVDFINVINRIEEEPYLRGFFDIYVNEDLRNGLTGKDGTYTILEKEKKIVFKLKERLKDIYSERDKAIEIEEIEKEYEFFKKQWENGNNGGGCKDNPERFIEKYFFQKVRKRDKDKERIKDCMRPDSIVDRMERNTEKFLENVVGRSKIHAGEELKGRLSVLRRWNSFTPALESSINPSKGGGYFLHFSYQDETLGIVVDPGYDFLGNFFSQGFKMGDIDMVLVSHVHPDHTNDFHSILSLFHEMNGRLGEYYYKKKGQNKRKNKKTLTLILSPGVFKHYSPIIEHSKETLKDIIVVNMKERQGDFKFENKDKTIEIKIKAFETSHRDLSQFQSLGFKIIVGKKDGPKTQIGFTGDAKWKENKWPKHLYECSIICAHLGSVVNVLDEKGFCNTFCKKFCKSDKGKKCKKLDECGFSGADVQRGNLMRQIENENHLYLAGLTLFFDSLFRNGNDVKVGVISEFGEELKDGIRIDLYNKFDAWFAEQNKQNKGRRKSREKPKCLPGDIGLEIDVFTGDVRCHCCNRFVDRHRIIPTPYGKEEAICFVCKECESVLSSYQIGEKLKDYCENGRKLELLVDESK